MCGGGWRSFPFGFGCGGGGFFPVSGHHEHNGHSSPEKSEYSVIKEELQKLYAAGKIDNETYTDSIYRLEKGRFNLDDLWQLRKGINNSPTSNKKYKYSELENKKTELVIVKEEVKITLENLQNSIVKLQQKIETEESVAKELIKYDETSTRKHIERRQDLVEQLSTLKIREKEAIENLEQLQELEDKINAKITEQTVSVQRNRLEKLEKMVNNL